MEMNGDPMLHAGDPHKGFFADPCPECGWEREPSEERVRFLENRVRVQDAELQEQEDRIRGLKERIQALEDQVKVLQKRPPRPKIKPSGLAQTGGNGREDEGAGKAGKRGPRRPTPTLRQRVVDVPLTGVPEAARRDGYEHRTVRDLVLVAEEVIYRLEVWRFPDGSRQVAPLPPGVVKGKEPVGPGIQALVIVLYHQCQSTVGRIVTFLNDLGLAISSRQVRRYLNEATEGIVQEAEEVLRAGLNSAAWINVDDTGARHEAQNGYCTVIGNDRFTHYRSTGSKSRLNFLTHLSAGETVYTVNEEAVAYMRRRNRSQPVISRLVDAPSRSFSTAQAWQDHLDTLGLSKLKISPNPVKIASEGARWGTICNTGHLHDTVIVSDEAGQFNVGIHALCWVHTERLIRKRWPPDDVRRRRVEKVLDQVWDFYRARSVYRETPGGALRETLSADFDWIAGQKTGYLLLDQQLERLKANKIERLRVLEFPSTPLHTNLAERDLRAHVTRRKISFGTRSEAGRLARDACLGALKTCQKLEISFWGYLNSRLGIAGAPEVPRLAELIPPCAESGWPGLREIRYHRDQDGH